MPTFMLQNPEKQWATIARKSKQTSPNDLAFNNLQMAQLSFIAISEATELNNKFFQTSIED